MVVRNFHLIIKNKKLLAVNRSIKMNSGSGEGQIMLRFISSLYISECYWVKRKSNPSFQMNFSWRLSQTINSPSLWLSCFHLLKISNFDFLNLQLSFDDASREVYICRQPKAFFFFFNCFPLQSFCPNGANTCACDWTLLIICCSGISPGLFMSEA